MRLLFLIGTITMEQALKNKEMSTDDLEPFDRTKNSGRVSTRPSSSASFTSSESGVKLGGDKGKDDSNLLVGGPEGSGNYANLISLGT